MKKNKLLIPILSASSVAITATSLLALASCTTRLSINYDKNNKYYITTARNYRKEKYIFNISYEPNNLLGDILKIGVCRETSPQTILPYIENGEITLKIDGAVVAAAYNDGHYEYDCFKCDVKQEIEIIWNKKNPIDTCCLKVWAE